jgi:RHS repeat-associated protein
LDEETGLYYYGARYYDARVSLWLITDPLQEKYTGMSTYAYAALNPVKYIDPLGTEPTTEEAQAIASHVYGNKPDDILLGGWKVSQRMGDIPYNDPNSGLNSALYERSKDGKTEYTYAFAGSVTASDWKNNATQTWGESSQYDLAVKNADLISQELKNFGDELSFVGHSLGGGLAAASAYATGGNAITFNAAGLSPFSIAKYGENANSAKIDAQIMLSDPLNLFQTLFGYSLLKADGNRTYVMPKNFQSVINGHSIDNMYKSSPSITERISQAIQAIEGKVREIIYQSMTP